MLQIDHEKPFLIVIQSKIAKSNVCIKVTKFTRQ